MRSGRSVVRKYSNMSRKGEQKGNDETGLETILRGARKRVRDEAMRSGRSVVRKYSNMFRKGEHKGNDETRVHGSAVASRVGLH
jgi:hypothetical protein